MSPGCSGLEAVRLAVLRAGGQGAHFAMRHGRAARRLPQRVGLQVQRQAAFGRYPQRHQEGPAQRLRALRRRVRAQPQGGRQRRVEREGAGAPSRPGPAAAGRAGRPGRPGTLPAVRPGRAGAAHLGQRLQRPGRVPSAWLLQARAGAWALQAAMAKRMSRRFMGWWRKGESGAGAPLGQGLPQPAVRRQRPAPPPSASGCAGYPAKIAAPRRFVTAPGVAPSCHERCRRCPVLPARPAKPLTSLCNEMAASASASAPYLPMSRC